MPETPMPLSANALPGVPPRERGETRARLALIGLAIGAVVTILLFMTLGAKGSWSFVLWLRGTKLAGLVLVAYSIAVSTVLFQTVTNNRILTPSIMGFDALYVLIQTMIVVLLGSSALADLPAGARFLGQVAAMMLFSALLFRFLFTGGERGLYLLILVGIVLGTFFRALSSFAQRVLDPNEFAILQDALFARFNMINTELLAIAAVVVLGASLVGFRMLGTLDVLALGRPIAIGLGVPYRRAVTTVLAIVAVLVSVSTALVGPVTFFGLLVASLAHAAIGTSRHRFVLPAAVLIGIIALVGGQTVLERLFASDTALSIIIEFVGGIVFLVLILRRGAR